MEGLELDVIGQYLSKEREWALEATFPTPGATETSTNLPAILKVQGQCLRKEEASLRESSFLIVIQTPSPLPCPPPRSPPMVTRGIYHQSKRMLTFPVLSQSSWKCGARNYPVTWERSSADAQGATLLPQPSVIDLILVRFFLESEDICRLRLKSSRALHRGQALLSPMEWAWENWKPLSFRSNFCLLLPLPPLLDLCFFFAPMHILTFPASEFI